MTKLKTITGSNKEQFDINVNIYLEKGWKISSTNCDCTVSCGVEYMIAIITLDN